jgi:CheY-like chemotaxis protein
VFLANGHFVLELPLTRGPFRKLTGPIDPTLKLTGEAAAGGPADALQHRRGWLLIVDDSPDAQDFFAACLTGSGFGLASASNGQEAIRMILDRSLPQAIILDLLMPEMNGFEFLALLRAYKRLSAIPVLVVTAHTGVAEGPSPDGYILHKPVERAKLLRTLDQLTGKAGG